MKRLGESLVIVLTVTFLVLGGLFLLSLATELYMPSTWVQRITLSAYGAGVALLLPIAFLALGGYLVLIWQKTQDGRFVLELPRSDGPQYITRVTTDRSMAYLNIGTSTITGVETGSARFGIRSIGGIDGTLRNPVPAQDEELTNIYLREQNGGRQ